MSVGSDCNLYKIRHIAYFIRMFLIHKTAMELYRKCVYMFFCVSDNKKMAVVTTQHIKIQIKKGSLHLYIMYLPTTTMISLVVSVVAI